MTEIGRRLAGVKAEVEAAGAACGRAPESVVVVAVSKRQPVEAIRAAYEAGQRDFGESYVQEWRLKAAALADLRGLRWHFVGHLQRNKMRFVAGRVSLVHGLDDEPGVAELGRRAAAAGVRQDVLLQVSLAGESSKRGCAPAALAPLARRVVQSPSLRLRGLMTMPPLGDDPELSRPLFARLRELSEGLRADLGARDAACVDLLSMGMSGDFHVAIAEGATHIRVGTAIFGPRPPPAA